MCPRCQPGASFLLPVDLSWVDPLCEEPIQDLYEFFCGVSSFFFLMCQSS